jgi:hypothetical protein
MKSAAQTAASQGTLGMNSMRTFAFEFGLAGQPELESGLAHRLLRRLPTDPSRHRGGVRNAAVALLASAERSCSAFGSKPQASPAEQKAPGTVLLRAFYFFRGFGKMALNTVSAGLASPPTLSGVLSLVFLHLLDAKIFLPSKKKHTVAVSEVLGTSVHPVPNSFQCSWSNGYFWQLNIAEHKCSSCCYTLHTRTCWRRRRPR